MSAPAIDTDEFLAELELMAKRRDVREVGRLLAERRKGTEIARRYGVSPSVISAIKRGLIYRHVTDRSSKTGATE